VSRRHAAIEHRRSPVDSVPAARSGCGRSSQRRTTKVFVRPKDRASVGVDLDRDISRRVAFCLIEDPHCGREIALVEFR
jgi:hypothetical protein